MSYIQEKICLVLDVLASVGFFLAVQIIMQIGFRMLQTSEGEVVSGDRGSESRINGDAFRKPVHLYCGSTFRSVCMTSKLLTISDQIFLVLCIYLWRITHDCQFAQINPCRMEYRLMRLNFKLPISSTVSESVYCASFKYSMILIAVQQIQSYSKTIQTTPFMIYLCPFSLIYSSKNTSQEPKIHYSV